MIRGFAFKRLPGKQAGANYVLLGLSVLLLSFFLAFMMEGISVINDTGPRLFNDAEFYAIFVANLACTIAFVALVNRNFHIPISIPWLFAFLVLFMGNAIGTIMFPEVYAGHSGHQGGFDYELVTELPMKFRFVFSFLSTCSFLYMCFAVFPRVFHSLRGMRYFQWLYILVCFSMIIYSLIKERDLYVYFFDTGGEYGSWIVSYLNNPNSFAYALILGIGSALLLHNWTNHWFYWVIASIFLFFQLPIASGAGIICSAFLFSAYVIYRYFVTVKLHAVSSTICLLIYIAFMMVLFIFLLTGCLGPDNFFTKAGAHIFDHFKGTTIYARQAIWMDAYSIVTENPITLFFGVGNTQAYRVLNAVEFPHQEGLIVADTFSYVHNGLFQALLEGGIVKAIVLLIVLIHILYKCIRLFIIKSRNVWPYLLFFITIVLQATVESTQFLDMETKGVVMYLLLLLPMETEWFRHTNPEVASYEEKAKLDASKRRFRYDMSPLRMAKIAFLFVTPAAILGLGVLPHLFKLATALAVYGGWNYYVTIALGYLAFPFAVYCLGYGEEKSFRPVKVISFSLIYFGVAISGVFLFPSTPIYGSIAPFMLLVLSFLAFLTHVKSFFAFREKLFVHAYLPHLLVFAVITAICAAFHAFTDQNIGYEGFISLIFVALALYMTFLFSGIGTKLLYPLGEGWEHFESRIVARGIIKEEKLNDKVKAHLEGKVRRSPKHVYVERI